MAKFRILGSETPENKNVGGGLIDTWLVLGFVGACHGMRLSVDDFGEMYLIRIFNLTMNELDV